MKFNSPLICSFVTILVLNSQAIAQVNQENSSYLPTTTSKKLVAKTPEEDAKITRTLKALLKQDPLLSKFKINIETNKGVVKYTGTVDSATQETLLAEYAESVIGVSDVDMSGVKVKSGQQPLTDALTTAKIKGLLIREKLFGERDISAINTTIETKDGVVYISGHVDNKEQIDNAIEIIKQSVPEVKRVEYSVRYTHDE